MTGQTARMAECVDIIREMSADGVPPTVVQLRDRLGLASTGTTQALLCRMRDRGLVDWIPGRARSLYIIEDQVSPAVLNALSDEALRTTAAHIAGILASRGGAYRVASAYRNIATQLLQPGRAA